MIRRRYPAILGALAALLLLLAASAAAHAVELFRRGNAFYLENSGQTSVDETVVYGIFALYEAMLGIVPWLVLGGVVAAIAALALLMLRARDQAGSASAATASRDASAASARS